MANEFIIKNGFISKGDGRVEGGLNIGSIGTGTSINNLGIDASGNVVFGTTGDTDTNTFVIAGTFNDATNTLSLLRNDGNFVHVTGVTDTFTGNTSGDCITDLYITNLHGCSPITVHDSIQSVGSSATGTTSFAFGFNTKAFGDYSHAEGNSTIASANYSHTEGYGTTASGLYSHAQGYGNLASGVASHAEGGVGFTGKGLLFQPTSATTYSARAEGRSTLASGISSHAEGAFTTASGGNSHAEGTTTTASNTSSHAEGNQTTASGISSHSEGNGTIASGNYSHAEGNQTTASGNYSHSEGFQSTTNSDYSHVGGQQNSIEAHDNNNIYGGKFQTISASTSANGCNTVSGGYNNQIVGGFASVAMGIGGYIDGSINYHFGQGSITEPTINSGAKQVVFGDGVATFGPAGKTNTILFDMFAGNGYWDGAADVGPADYAEYFEWNDGNTLDEDRVGYFVSLVSNTEKIEMSNNNVIGIVSAKPAIVGDSAFFGWQNRYVMDEWGRDLSDEYDMYLIKMTGDTADVTIYISENGTVYSEYPNLGNPNGVLYNESTDDKIFIQKTMVKRINPSYDPTQQYIPRENRPEWSPIGLLGKLRVKTAEQITGPSVSVNSNGMAINGSDYPVLETIKAFDGNYGIVKVLFK